ncbi:MAG: nicotinate-nucleotide--dimethylbenzimidazole phosphoribosyltransferase [Chloroflexaceae bacterium]|nr:nicotinate-nucleotide--dimethylbenzimidazole phosphoribosyltransferase [Chloroflexaceae bacterium]
MTNPTPDPIRACAAQIAPADGPAMIAVQQRLDHLTKPQGSLGQLEHLLVRLAGSTAHALPQVQQPVILLCAADHGIAVAGVSAYPQAVTAQMVLNFLAGGAAISVLAHATNTRLIVVDAGVVGDLPDHPDLHRLHIRRGTANLAAEPAMTLAEAHAAVLAGMTLAQAAHADGMDMLLVGEMGIGNTTAAATLTSALTGAPPTQTVGRGTGIDAARLAHKQALVAQALRRVGLGDGQRWDGDALLLLAEVGGLELAVLVGAMLAAAAQRIPILLDGYITTAAALVAARLAPQLPAHLIAAHCSAEPGHALALAELGLTGDNAAAPLLQLELRLGEGSGAALALPLIQHTLRLLHTMATFEAAGVSTA